MPSAAPRLTLDQVLAIAEDEERLEKLNALVRRLIEENPALDEETRETLLARLEEGGRRGSNGLIRDLGQEAALAFLIGELPENAALVAQWREQFAEHPDRAAIFAGLSGENLAEELQDWERRTRGWTSWEQQQYRDLMLRKLGVAQAAEAVAELQERPGLYSDAALERTLQSITEAYRDVPNRLDNMLENLQDPRVRTAFIEAQARERASGNTLEALDWADSLATQAERDRAHEIIYEQTPRGIGVMMRQDGGFPTVVETMENGPSAGILQSGDRIVQLSENGTTVDLYNQPFRRVINSIRGEAGTPVTLKVLRWDDDAGQMREMDVPLSREQLFFEGNSAE
jgi:hypothetical protein